MELDAREVPYVAREIVDQYLDTLIGKVREVVDETKIYEDRDIMGKSQFTNLTSVARETESLEIIVTWIQYQIGRTTKPDATWRRNGFGERVIAALQQLHDTAKILIVAQRITDAQVETRMIKAVRIGLVRQYIGQMERYITYKRNVSGGNRNA